MRYDSITYDRQSPSEGMFWGLQGVNRPGVYRHLDSEPVLALWRLRWSQSRVVPKEENGIIVFGWA
jgi:hypothetical protein